MPFEDEFKMVFTTYEEGITSEDFNFDEIFVKNTTNYFLIIKFKHFGTWMMIMKVKNHLMIF